MLRLAADGEKILLWLAALGALLVLIIYVLGKVRARTLQHEPGASEMLAKFQELHSRGVLSDAEFRTIRTTLTAQRTQELKDTGETG